MSASGNKLITQGLTLENDGTCKIVVFYEDAVARLRVMSVCDRLVDQFAEDLDFEFKWWKFKRLSDAGMARIAMEVATEADIVMFCARGTEYPAEAIEWLDTWTESGVESDGALTLVLTEHSGKAETPYGLISFFKSIAQKLGMDFLHLQAPRIAESPTTITANLPPAALNVERAHSYHWGLNE